MIHRSGRMSYFIFGRIVKDRQSAHKATEINLNEMKWKPERAALVLFFLVCFNSFLSLCLHL